MRKLSVLLSVAMIFALTGCGCGNENDEAVTVRFLNFKPEIASVYEKIAKEYKEETGVNIVVETAAANTYESTLTAKMSTKEAPTIFQVNGPKGYANWKDYCENIEDYKISGIVADEDMLLYTDDGVFGVPYVVEGYGIIYNKGITDRFFELDDRKTKIESMEEIEGFDDLKEVVEEMNEKKAELGIDGVFAATSLKPGEDWRWQTHLMNVPVHYEFLNKGIGLESDAVADFEFEYADNYKKLFDLYIENSTTDKKMLGSKIVGDSMAEFAQGKCAMVQNGNWAYSQIAEVDGNKIEKDNVRMLPLYMGIKDEKQGLCIGTENFLCINKKADEKTKQAADDFLYWLFSSDKGKKYVTEELGFIAPFSTFDEEETPNDPLAREVVRWMNDDDTDTIGWDFTVFPSQVFKTNFGSDLLQYAQGTKSWEDVKKETVADWKAESGK